MTGARALRDALARHPDGAAPVRSLAAPALGRSLAAPALGRSLASPALGRSLAAPAPAASRGTGRAAPQAAAPLGDPPVAGRAAGPGGGPRPALARLAFRLGRACALALALVIALATGLAGAAQAACRDDRVTLRGDWGQAAFTVRVADDNASRSQGLMNVPEMPRMAGMLFVYEAPQRATFWMRNTLIPLDMIFASPEGEVLRVHENAVPLDETTIDGGTGVQYVLEINGGMAARLGIGPGDLMQHPAIGPDAAWPCAEAAE